MPILRLVAAAGLLLAGCGGDCPETAPVTSNQTSGGSAGRVPMLEAGVPITLAGELTEADESMEEHFVDRYPIRLGAGQHLDVVMWSAEFDTYLILLDPNGERLDEDDDGMGSLDAYLRTQVEQPGTYTIVASSYGAGRTGHYALAVRSGDEPPEMALNAGEGLTEDGYGRAYQEMLDRIDTMPVDRSIQGQLTTSSPRMQEEELTFYYDEYAVELQPGQTLFVRMESDFDTYLYLYGPSGDEVASNDDSDSLNSFIEFEAAEPGTYRIRATSYSDEDTGPYELRYGVDGP